MKRAIGERRREAEERVDGKGFELNADGYPLMILRQNMTTLAHTWKNTNYSHFQSKTDTKIYQMQEAYLQELGLTFLIPII